MVPNLAASGAGAGGSGGELAVLPSSAFDRKAAFSYEWLPESRHDIRSEYLPAVVALCAPVLGPVRDQPARLPALRLYPAHAGLHSQVFRRWTEQSGRQLFRPGAPPERAGMAGRTEIVAGSAVANRAHCTVAGHWLVSRKLFPGPCLAGAGSRSARRAVQQHADVAQSLFR